MVLSPRLSLASVVNAITVSARPVSGVSEIVGGTRSLCGSIDVLSLHAATTRDNDAAAAATTKPRRRTPESSLCIRVTFNGWLVGSDSSERQESARRRRGRKAEQG